MWFLFIGFRESRTRENELFREFAISNVAGPGVFARVWSGSRIGINPPRTYKSVVRDAPGKSPGRGISVTTQRWNLFGSSYPAGRVSWLSSKLYFYVRTFIAARRTLPARFVVRTCIPDVTNGRSSYRENLCQSRTGIPIKILYVYIDVSPWSSWTQDIGFSTVNLFLSPPPIRPTTPPSGI